MFVYACRYCDVVVEENVRLRKLPTPNIILMRAEDTLTLLDCWIDALRRTADQIGEGCFAVWGRDEVVLLPKGTRYSVATDGGLGGDFFNPVCSIETIAQHVRRRRDAIASAMRRAVSPSP